MALIQSLVCGIFFLILYSARVCLYRRMDPTVMYIIFSVLWKFIPIQIFTHKSDHAWQRSLEEWKKLIYPQSVQYMYWVAFLMKYRVRQKYLTIWQHSCEWNCWRGEFVLERSSSETQSTSVAMECWSVEHRAFAVETYF